MSNRPKTIRSSFRNKTTFKGTFPLDVQKLLETHAIQANFIDYDAGFTKMMELIYGVTSNDQGVTVTIDDQDNVYITKGNAESYPALVAHWDQVHAVVSPEYFHLNINGDLLYAFDSFNMQQCGTGSDDKAGMYICLEALRYLDHVKIVFFADEEIGCQGSSNCDMSFFDDVNIILQGDRFGDNEWITYSNGVDLADKKFIMSILPILKKYGYKDSQEGTLTDVGQLTLQNCGVVTANVSVGYKNQHSEIEILHLPSVERALNLMLEVAQKYSTTPATFVQPVKDLLYQGHSHTFGYTTYEKAQ